MNTVLTNLKTVNQISAFTVQEIKIVFSTHLPLTSTIMFILRGIRIDLDRSQCNKQPIRTSCIQQHGRQAKRLILAHSVYPSRVICLSLMRAGCHKAICITSEVYWKSQASRRTTQCLSEAVIFTVILQATVHHI